MAMLTTRSSVSQEQNERHKLKLAECLRDLPTNKFCADCGLRNPTWCARMRAHAMCLVCRGQGVSAC
jgi:hypothetical protein